MAYLLDANVFIQAKNFHYGMDFCPGFWRWLILAGESGLVFSIDKVFEELDAGNDELKAWAREHKSLFVHSDAGLAAHLARTSTWVYQKGYSEPSISAFFGSADNYLIAHALSARHIVVTHEKAAPQGNKIKIPDLCSAFGLACCNPYQMLSREKARLILRQP